MLSNRIYQIAFVAVIAALALLTVSMVAAPHGSSTTSSNDQIELRRAQSIAAAAISASSYDQIELLRAQRYAVVVSSVHSSDQIELQRAQRYAAAAAQQAYLAHRRGEWTGK